MIDPAVLRDTMADLGQPPYRATQVYQALTRGLVTDFAAIGVLPAALRAALAERLQPLSLTPVETRCTATGDARKTLFETHDGRAVEAVLMVYPQRATVCVSSQVGCSVGCAFCASGAHGLVRGLLGRGDGRPGAALRPRAARRRAEGHQRGLHGHGGAVPQLRRDAARLPPAATTPRASAWARAACRSRPRGSCRRCGVSPPRSRRSTWP